MNTNSPDLVQKPNSGVGDLLDDGDQRTADAAEERRYHVPHQQHVARRRAEIFEPRFIRLDGPQHVAERAFEVALHAVERRDRDHEAHIEDDVLERLRREGKSQQARTRDPDAVGTVGVVEHLLQQRPQHHREREVEHAEEDFAVAHHEQADDESDDGGRYATQHDVEQDVAATDKLSPEGRTVGAGRKEHRVPEQHLSRLQQQHDAEHDDALGEDQREQRRPARHEQRRQRCDHKEDNGDRRDWLETAGHQIFLTWTAPNRPNGRTSSTSTINRYGTSAFELGLDIDDERPRQADHERGERGAFDLPESGCRGDRKGEHDHVGAHARAPATWSARPAPRQGLRSSRR